MRAALPAMLLIALAGPAQAQDCDPELHLADALDRVAEVDFTGARASLTRAETAFACGDLAGSGLVARLWLIEGALDALDGDEEGAARAWQSASAAAPGLWVDALGPRMRARFDAAVAATPDVPFGTLRIDASGYDIAVDGKRSGGLLEVPAGYHLIQVAEPGGSVRYARVARIRSGQTTVISPSLAPRMTEPEPEPVAAVPEPEPSSAPAAVRGQLGLGTRVLLGQSLTGARGSGAGNASEPSTKILIPVEGSVVIAVEPAWARATVAVAPLAGGELLFAGTDGLAGTRLAVLGAIAGGATAGPVLLGAEGSLLYPGRLALLGVAGIELGSGFAVEVRGGPSLPTERRVEPTVALAVVRTFGKPPAAD